MGGTMSPIRRIVSVADFGGSVGEIVSRVCPESWRGLGDGPAIWALVRAESKWIARAQKARRVRIPNTATTSSPTSKDGSTISWTSGVSAKLGSSWTR
ncbi:MAG: hypothetical protein AMS19_05980 [Gemmatimonas sp. SG8_23]|jgi:hypothetical protein|nr:MAG: hypothetical protein AMS19_05980 [Gemmatimonas sp. SG8_23]